MKIQTRTQRDFADVLEMDDEPTATTTKPATTKPASIPASNPFGGPSAPAVAPAAGSIFGSLPTAPGSIFGTLPTAPGGGSGSGSLFPPAASGGGLFGNLGGVAPGAGAAAAAAAEDEDEDEPPRPSSPSYQANQATEDENETVLLRVGKVKFHTKKDAADKNWADRGVNSFEFRREKASGADGKHRCRVLMRNQIGKAVLNAGVYKGLSAQLTEKKQKDGSTIKNGLIATLFNAEEENAKTMVYLRFGKESDAVELQKLIADNAQ